MGRDSVAKHEFIALLPIPRHKDQPGLVMFGWFDVAEGDKFNRRWQRHRNAAVSDPTLKRVEHSAHGCATPTGSEPFPSIPVALPPVLNLPPPATRNHCNLHPLKSRKRHILVHTHLGRPEGRSSARAIIRSSFRIVRAVSN